MQAMQKQRSTVSDRQIIAADFRPQPLQRIIEHEADDDLVLYDPAKDAVYVLNDTAAVIWWLCDGQRTTEGITAQLARLYGSEQAAVAGDVEETLSELCNNRLVIGS